jgi:hypothetical protein
MDLNQIKLSKEEWTSLEMPINVDLKKILVILRDGFTNIDISKSNITNINTYLKINNSEIIDKYIYITYIEPVILNIENLFYKKINSKKIIIKKADKIRFNNIDKTFDINNKYVFEFILLKIIKTLYLNLNNNNKNWHHYYYTLTGLLYLNFNNEFKKIIEYIIKSLQNKLQLDYIIYNSVNIIQNNDMLIKYQNTELYQHQKDIYSIFNDKKLINKSKLIFYTAPTGTGKTLTPIGLLHKYKIIFVCAARHIGLSIAKNAINLNKKIAFSFGCDHEEDIRLHYFSAKKFDKNYKTGGIYKVDNSVGDNVEMIISDIKSYLIAMKYMLKFNSNEHIITYWDEPTITLDKKDNDIHKYISVNCKENKINNIIFSCATMPSVENLTETINSFKNKFNNSEIIKINSYDCSKSIKILNSHSYVELPHYLYNDYSVLTESINYINKNKTLLRYLDLQEILNVIKLINTKYTNSITNKNFIIDNYFNSINDISIKDIKIYYLKLLLNLNSNIWKTINKDILQTRTSLYNNVINLTTTDSYTLTDGPTIYLSNNEDNIAKFLIQTANIPSNEINRLITIINENNIINDKINEISKILNDKYADCKIENNEYKELNKDIRVFQNKIKTITIDEQYIPNFNSHIKKYANHNINNNNKLIFKSNIPEHIIKKIMLINIENYWKLLLIMGIGVFSNQKNKDYIEIMKNLADNQKLLLIIASSDYIYGTNYQFCHCYIGKDLNDITSQKLIQSIGRVGRTNKQLDYSVRFRNNNMLDLLFREDNNNNIEKNNFNKLFNFN